MNTGEKLKKLHYTMPGPYLINLGNPEPDVAIDYNIEYTYDDCDNIIDVVIDFDHLQKTLEIFIELVEKGAEFSLEDKEILILEKNKASIQRILESLQQIKK